MHSRKITHRDIKPENLLIDDSGSFQIKLTDFGFACFFDPEVKMDLSLGSPIYMAPELIREKEYDQSVDIWSIGIVTYVCLCGMAPFISNDKNQMYD